MSYIIHGATGAQGGPLYARLLASGKNAVAAVRDPAKVAAQAAVAVDNESVESLTSAALAELFALAEMARSDRNDLRPRHIAALIEAGAELGLLQKSKSQWQAEVLSCSAGSADETRISGLRDKRAAARVRGDFADANLARDKLLALRAMVEDQALAT